MTNMNQQQTPGWCWTSLDKLSKVLAGNPAPQEAERFAESGPPFVRVQDMGRLGTRMWLTDTRDHLNESEAHDLRLFPVGSVLFTKSGASTLLNQRAILQRPMYVVSHIAAVIPEEGILSEWLFYWLSTLDFADHAHATTLPSLPLSKIRNITAPVAPTAEQSRVVDALDELFSELNAGVAALERIRDRLKLYRASVLKAAVEGTLTANWREEHPEVEPASELLNRVMGERRRLWEANQIRRFEQQSKTPTQNWKTKYKEPVSLDTADLPVLPKSWCWSNLDTVIVKGPQNGLYLPSRKYGEGTEILRIDDFQNDWIRPRGRLKKVQAEEDALETYTLHVDDLVINRVNSLTHLGKCVIITEQLSGVLFESNMMRAKLAATCDAKYLQYYLHSDSGRRRLTQDAKWAVNQASINQQDVKKTPIPVPPLAEQEAIVEIVEGQLSVVNYLEAEVEAKLQNAQALRQAILRHAFTGKLVSQNPNDEPASELLKRISDQRDARAREAVAAKTLSRETANAHTTQSHSVKLRKEKID